VSLLSRALELSGLDARAAMTPREEVDSVPQDAGVAEVEAVAARSGRSRILVRGGSLDDPLGVVHVRDTLVLDAADREARLARDLAYSVIEVAPEQRLEDVLLQMRTEHRQFAVVLEDGALVGVVTMQDVLERLVVASDEDIARP
jgi:CBS domain containing-hemolysin-like protein